jgi:hypothetical protein
MRSPSVKRLAEVFGSNAKQAKKVFAMSRDDLLETEAGRRREDECFNPPKLWDLRMHVLDNLAETSGIEEFITRKGEHVEYLNAGDTYAATLVYFRGNYYVGCWGDYAERYGTND